MDKDGIDVLQFMDPLIQFHVRKDTPRQSHVSASRLFHPMLEVVAANILQYVLGARGQVLSAERVRQGLLQGFHGRPVEHLPFVDGTAVSIADEPSKDVGIGRLTVPGQTRDLSLMLLRLETTNVCHIRVVITDRIKAINAPQSFKVALPHGVDV